MTNHPHHTPRISAQDSVSAALLSPPALREKTSSTVLQALPAYAQLAAIIVNERPLGVVLRRVVELAARLVPGADDVSITLIDHGRPRSVAFTGQLAAALDERQYADGFGPCMDAALTGQTITIEDTALDRHYPEFSRQARRHGIHHTLSLALPALQDTAGALNIYGAAEAGPFDQDTLDIAATFASYAAIGLLNAALYAGALDEIAHLRQAMASRAGIEQAKGILMGDRHCTPDQAFDVLRDTAARTHRKLRDVAQTILDSASHH